METEKLVNPVNDSKWRRLSLGEITPTYFHIVELAFAYKSRFMVLHCVCSHTEQK
jgi:hypothetical protein